MNAKLNGNKSYGLGGAAGIGGGLTVLQDIINSGSLENVNMDGLMFLTIGLAVITLRHAISKVQRSLEAK